MKNKLVAAAGLTVIWVLLWGRPTVLNVLGGMIIATIVLTVFPLPPITFGGRISPLGVLRFFARFLSDLVVASVQIAVLAFRFGHTPRSAVVGVRLRVPTDLNLTLTSEALSLVPGSLIVEVDRETGTLYMHVLGGGDIEAFRRSVLDLEARIIDAIGTPEQRKEIKA